MAASRQVGTVEEILPSLLYRVRLEGGRLVRATLTPEARHQLSQVCLGDTVQVELSPFDPTRARITNEA